MCRRVAVRSMAGWCHKCQSQQMGSSMPDPRVGSGARLIAGSTVVRDRGASHRRRKFRPAPRLDSCAPLSRLCHDRSHRKQSTDRRRTRTRAALRPQSLREYVGQPRMKNPLEICIEAAKRRGEALDHAIFYGPLRDWARRPSRTLSPEMGSAIRSTSGLVLGHAGDLAAILTNLQERDVLFIDEIHRLPASVEEALYPAMEDYQLDLVVGQGASTRPSSWNCRLPWSEPRPGLER